MEPLVSILIPAYNAQQWIAETIRSALDQTWPRKEIIIVDDGSRDETLRIAQQFSSKEVAVVSQPNQGAAAARNHAFSLSQGDYVQWLDADDLLSPEKIKKQMVVAAECGDKRLLFSSAWGHFAYRPDKAVFRKSSLWFNLSPLEWMLYQMEENLHMQTATWLVSRELTSAAGPWDTRLLADDDGEYFCRALLSSKGTRFVPAAKVFYRIAGPSRLSHIGRSQRKMQAQLVSMELHIKYIRSLQDSDRVRTACVNYLQTWSPLIKECPEAFRGAQQLAVSLGGELKMPGFSWKYAWIERLFGWRAANAVRLRYNHHKWQFLRTLDKALLRWESRGQATP